MLSSSGSLEYAFRRAEEFAAKAIHALADFEKNEARDALIETAEFMAGKGRIPHP
jgi:geranylgeranyl pyrophosphate synthase